MHRGEPGIQYSRGLRGLLQWPYRVIQQKVSFLVVPGRADSDFLTSQTEDLEAVAEVTLLSLEQDGQSNKRLA